MNEQERELAELGAAVGPTLITELGHLFVKAIGGPAKAQAWLAAEYAAADASLDVYEAEKLDRETAP